MNPDAKRPPATPAPYEDLHEVARNIHEKERAADASLEENLAKSLRILEGGFAKLRARLAEEADPSVTSPSKKTKTDDDTTGSDVAKRREENFGNDPNSVPVALIASAGKRIDFTTLKWSELKTYCKEVTGAAGRTKEECMRKLNDHFNQLALATTNTSVDLSTSEVSGQGSSTQPVSDVWPISDEDDLAQLEQMVRKQQQQVEATKQKIAAKMQAQKKQAEEQAAKARQQEFEERERQRLLEEERLAEEQRLIEQAKKEEEERQARLREKAKKEQEDRERRRLEKIADDERKAKEAEAERQRKAKEAEEARKADEERKAKQAEAERQRKAKEAEEARKAKESEEARKAKEAEEARKAKELEDQRKAEDARKAKELENERQADEARKAKELKDKAKEMEEEASQQATGKPEDSHDAKSLSKQLAIEAQQRLNNGSQFKKRVNDLAPQSSSSQTKGKHQPKFFQNYPEATPRGRGSGGNLGLQPSPARPLPVDNSPSIIVQTVNPNTPLMFRPPGVKPAHQPVAPAPAVVASAPQPGPVVHQEDMENKAELSPNKIPSSTLPSNNKPNMDMDSLLHSDSDDEDGQEWTRSHNLKAALREQFEGRKDPDTIFPNMALMEFPMEAIFKKKRDQRRSSGATWMQNGPSDEPYRVFRHGGGGHHPPY